MKYIITDQNELVVGVNTYHQIMAKEVKGDVIAAGHFRLLSPEPVKVEVYGESIGYGIKAREGDALKIERLFGSAIHV